MPVQLVIKHSTGKQKGKDKHGHPLTRTEDPGVIPEGEQVTSQRDPQGRGRRASVWPTARGRRRPGGRSAQGQARGRGKLPGPRVFLLPVRTGVCYLSPQATDAEVLTASNCVCTAYRSQ